VSDLQAVAVLQLEGLTRGLVPGLVLLVEKDTKDANTFVRDPYYGVTAVRPNVPAVALSNALKSFEGRDLNNRGCKRNHSHDQQGLILQYLHLFECLGKVYCLPSEDENSRDVIYGV